MSEMLEMLIGTKLDTKGAQEQLDKFVKTASKTKVIDLGNGAKEFQTLTKYVNEFGASYKRLTTHIQEANGNWRQTSNNITEINAEYKNLNQTLSKNLVETSKYTDIFRTASGGLKTVITEVNAEGQKIRTTINEVDNGLGRVTKTTEVYNETLQKQISKHTESVSNQAKVVDGIKKEQEALSKDTVEKEKNAVASGNATNANKKLGQSFSDIITKVTKFYLASLPIRVVQTMVTDATQAVKDFDKAFTELAKVSSLSGDSLKEYADILADIGTEVARTKTEMVQTATELTKAGYNPQDVEVLSKLVALYQNTADEELSAADATSVLVSQMKAFDIEAEEAIHITDAINQVSQDFAVSSGDIGRGLTQAGAALSTYGNSFDQTIGLITAGTEIFQGKSQQVTICGLLNIA